MEHGSKGFLSAQGQFAPALAASKQPTDSHGLASRPARKVGV